MYKLPHCTSTTREADVGSLTRKRTKAYHSILASVSLHQGTTFARRHRCLAAALTAAVSLVGAIAPEVAVGETTLVHVKDALLRQRAVTR
uniref:Uncharacterized protein n=1 Tax=Rhipicephalus appendiculatus TaxID=34631 RepID=A0A131YA76_RHIAP